MPSAASSFSRPTPPAPLDGGSGGGAGVEPPASTVRLLDYGHGQKPSRRIRWRHLVLAGLLVGCALGSWTLGRQARDRAQFVLYQRQAAAYLEPANVIVYESDPAAAQALIDAGTHVSLSRESPAPAALREPRSLGVFRRLLGPEAMETMGALVFLHELTTPSGARRIVAVQFLPHYLDGRTLPGTGLVAYVIEPGGFARDPRSLGRSEARLLVPADASPLEEVLPKSSPGDDVVGDVQLPPEALADHAAPGLTSPVLKQAFDPWGRQQETLRWYAGQPDELDPSHFTIDYEIDGVRGTIDGYLSDDGGHVRMHARPHHVPGGPSGNLLRVSFGTIR